MTAADTDTQEGVRLDKWLWAARFFKTRSLAHKAIDGGKIRLNGQNCKPSRLVAQGDVLRIHRDDGEYTVTILGLNEQRRPAKEARLLYEESPESLARRELEHSQRRLHAYSAPHPERRPDKKARRQLIRMGRHDHD
ncbi:MAG: heat-shock protein [Gammaproteobacteria bacterium]|nr:heat-shock protein [Gammaproteobacteria bacterium]